ncbi:LytR C-terminal domain-containing protein [Candidatus Daviesbacteria bacterium]|nr:LytR C-terminal domain-containing protein [Candidatus Daviesbacteria bacterium]
MRIRMDHINYKLVIPAVALVGLVILGGGFLLYQNQKSQVLDDSQTISYQDVKKLVEEVSKLIDLPEDETPAVTTITDVAKMQDRPFFQRAKNGDKVLIYTNVAKAILYDPITKKVIDVASLNIGTSSAKVQVLLKVALRNGTKTSGLTTKIEDRLRKENLQFEVSSKENAERGDYDKTLVVVLNESSKKLAESIANLLNVTVGELPEREIKPKDADIVIILGKDAI